MGPAGIQRYSPPAHTSWFFRATWDPRRAPRPLKRACLSAPSRRPSVCMSPSDLLSSLMIVRNELFSMISPPYIDAAALNAAEGEVVSRCDETIGRMDNAFGVERRPDSGGSASESMRPMIASVVLKAADSLSRQGLQRNSSSCEPVLFLHLVIHGVSQGAGCTDFFAWGIWQRQINYPYTCHFTL